MFLAAALFMVGRSFYDWRRGSRAESLAFIGLAIVALSGAANQLGWGRSLVKANHSWMAFGMGFGVGCIVVRLLAGGRKRSAI